MSAPTGNDKGKKPSNSSTGSPVDEAGGSGQPADGPSQGRGTAHGEQTGGGGGRQPGGAVPPSTGGTRRGRGQFTNRASRAPSEASSRDTSMAPSSAGGSRQVGSVLGKRPRNPIGEAMIQGAKRPATGLLVVPQSEACTQKDMFGNYIDYQTKDPAKRGQTFATPNNEQPNAVDIVFKPDAPDGYTAFGHAVETLAVRGAKKVVVTVAGIYPGSTEDDLYESAHRERLTYKKTGETIDLTEDDSASVMSGPVHGKRGCKACGSRKHPTKYCHKPATDGTTVVCPYHNVSSRQDGGHSLDGLDRSKGYCSCLMEFEDSSRDRTSSQFRRHLRMAFEKLVVDRRRKPVCRVIKAMHCPISLAIEFSDAFCDGEIPDPLKEAWPYTKRDLRNRELVAKLNSCEKHDWRKMPPGELEGMEWDHIKKEYGSSIERQNRRGLPGPDEDSLMADAPPPRDSEAGTAGQANASTSTGDGQGRTGPESTTAAGGSSSTGNGIQQVTAGVAKLKATSQGRKQGEKATATAGAGAGTRAVDQLIDSDGRGPQKKGLGQATATAGASAGTRAVDQLIDFGGRGPQKKGLGQATATAGASAGTRAVDQLIDFGGRGPQKGLGQATAPAEAGAGAKAMAQQIGGGSTQTRSQPFVIPAEVQGPVIEMGEADPLDNDHEWDDFLPGTADAQRGQPSRSGQAFDRENHSSDAGSGEDDIMIDSEG